MLPYLRNDFIFQPDCYTAYPVLFSNPAQHMQALYKQFIFQFLLFASLLSCASATTLDRILVADEPPPGVVIEIVTGDNQGLDWALPQAQSYIKQLRQRFPGVPIAIVTHGREQFALQKNRRGQAKKIHSLTQSLRREDVRIHVCGTLAGWEGLSDEDFPDYVNVAPAGPAQINDYLALDYKLIVIKRR